MKKRGARTERAALRRLQIDAGHRARIGGEVSSWRRPAVQRSRQLRQTVETGTARVARRIVVEAALEIAAVAPVDEVPRPARPPVSRADLDGEMHDRIVVGRLSGGKFLIRHDVPAPSRSDSVERAHRVVGRAGGMPRPKSSVSLAFAGDPTASSPRVDDANAERGEALSLCTTPRRGAVAVRDERDRHSECNRPPRRTNRPSPPSHVTTA